MLLSRKNAVNSGKINWAKALLIRLMRSHCSYPLPRTPSSVAILH